MEIGDQIKEAYSSWECAIEKRCFYGEMIIKIRMSKMYVFNQKMISKIFLRIFIFAVDMMLYRRKCGCVL